MKLLHTSDWHLGMVFRGGISYREDQMFFIHEICKIAVREKVDGILIAGDIFDKGIASQEALAMYDYAMTHICGELQIPVYLVAGNHDGAERVSQCSELLKSSGLYIAGMLEKEPQIVSCEDTDIYLLPWISTDKVKAVYPEQAEEVDSMEAAYRVVLEHYREHFVTGKKNILVAHAFIVDAETSVSDRAAEIGHATAVGSYLFDGFDYVALGHLHGPQSIGEHIRYSGTPMAYSFGKEEKQEKSVTIIDTETMELRVLPIPQLHRRTTLAGTYDELMAADFEQDLVDGYVRLEVSDKFVGMEAMASFREKYRNMLEISGKAIEREDATITMTIEELEEADSDPEEVFKRYCGDILEQTPSSHLMQLFQSAMEAYEKEVSES